jgi:hypothetical protein
MISSRDIIRVSLEYGLWNLGKENNCHNTSNYNQLNIISHIKFIFLTPIISDIIFYQLQEDKID